MFREGVAAQDEGDIGEDTGRDRVADLGKVAGRRGLTEEVDSTHEGVVLAY